jgi:cupin fold WbuC family metalloprotein
MLIFGTEEIQSLHRRAQERPRRRINHNIHPELSDPVQRLFNAIQPLSYVQPHRHIGDDAWEGFLLVEGEGVALTFDEQGFVTHRAHLQMEGTRMVEIPTSTYHSLLALQKDTLFFEIKRGPYDPNQAKDFASWAPEEGEEDVLRCARWFQDAQVGMRYS